MNEGMSPLPGGKTSLGSGVTNEPAAGEGRSGFKDGSGRSEAVFRSSFDEAEKKGAPRSKPALSQEEDGTISDSIPEEPPAGHEVERTPDSQVIPGEGPVARSFTLSSWGGGRIFIERAGIAGMTGVFQEIEQPGAANGPGTASLRGFGVIGTANAWYPYQVMNTDYEESFSGGQRVQTDVKTGEGPSAPAGSLPVPASVAASAADAQANVEAPRASTSVGSVAKAVEVVQYLGERLRFEGRDSATLRLVFDDGKSLTVRLTVADDTVRTTFRVDSSSLQQALQMHWSQVSHQAEDRGLRFATPVFESATGDSRDESHHSDERAHPGDDFSGDRTTPLDQRRREDPSQSKQQRNAGGWRAWA